MLRLRDPQGSLWDQLLPIQVRRLSAELTAIDTCLADERFFEPYLQRFNTLIGRPTVPVETYLRLMYLKHRYRLGYETLVKEVTDSLHWRRFCHLALDAPVPHATTLSKLTRKYGPTILHDLNRALVQRACEAKLVRCRKLRPTVASACLILRARDRNVVRAATPAAWRWRTVRVTTRALSASSPMSVG